MLFQWLLERNSVRWYFYSPSKSSRTATEIMSLRQGWKMASKKTRLIEQDRIVAIIIPIFCHAYLPFYTYFYFEPSFEWFEILRKSFREEMMFTQLLILRILVALKVNTPDF